MSNAPASSSTGSSLGPGPTALDLGPGLRPGTYPHDTVRDALGWVGEKILLRALGPAAFPSLSLVPLVCRRHGLAGPGAFLERYHASQPGIQELWESRPRETAAEVEAFYAEHDADLWRQAYRSRWSRSYRSKTLVVCRIVRRLLEGDRTRPVLDYGCGAGALAHRLLAQGYTRVHVADLESPTLQFCRDALGRRLAGVHVVGEGLPPPPGPFAAVLCVDCLEHTVNPLAIVQSLVGSLAPGGGLVVSYPLETDFRFTHTRAAADQRPRVMAFLNEHLEVILPQRVFRLPPGQP